MIQTPGGRSDCTFRAWAQPRWTQLYRVTCDMPNWPASAGSVHSLALSFSGGGLGAGCRPSAFSASSRLPLASLLHREYARKDSWPTSWGATPDWPAILLDHTPYVALNRLHREILQSLVTLRLERFTYPTLAEPLKTTHDVTAALARDKHLIANYDVETRFMQEAAVVQAAIQAGLDEGHALVNGKWLVDVFAPRTLGRTWDRHRCRAEWIAHAVSVGGLLGVRDLWQGITGRPP